MSVRILVLGGKGFIGRHAIAALRTRGLEPVIGTRSPAPASNEQLFRLENKTSASTWREVTAQFDVILNCVGILRPRGAATYERVHHQAPAAIASACEGTTTRFIQVSALGLSPSDRSGFLRTKLSGEQAIAQTRSDWIIVRPSLLDGEGGYGAAWLRGVARLPVFITPTDAQGAIAALTATDLGEALAQLCTAEPAKLRLEHSRIFELGGERTYTFAQYIRGLRRNYSARKALVIPIPGLLARAGAHLCDLLRFSPFSFGHWELLRKDNKPDPNRLPELLGRAPSIVIEEV